MSAVYQDEVKGLDEEYVVYDRIIKLRGSEYNITKYEVNVDLPTDLHVPSKAFRNCGLIKSSFNNDFSDEGIEKAGGDLVPLDIPTKYLKDIVEYLIHHQEDVNIKIIPKPLTSNNLKDVCKGMDHGCDPWDVDYINKFSNKELYEVISHANNMDISGLLHLGCAKVASMIKGQPLEKIRDILAVK
jgi:S-phase kinase-associated protein 1